MTQPSPAEGIGPTIYFLTAGKSPRHDLTVEITRALKKPVNAHEIGALDHLSDAEIAALAPVGEENQIITSTGPNQWVVLSEARLALLMEQALTRIPTEQRPLVVILSTGLMGDFQAPFPTVNAQRALETTISALADTGEDIGIIQPLEHQVRSETIPALGHLGLRKTCAHTGNTAELEAAARALQGCAIIALNSVSYSESDADIVRSQSGRRVLLARRIVTSAIQLLLSTGEFQPAQSAIAPEAIAHMTPRERQVLPLMAEGLSSKLIARQLGISPKTVEIHRTNIMRKLNVRSARELIYLMASSRAD